MSHNRRKSVRRQSNGDKRRRSEIRTRRRFSSMERLEDRILLAADINPFHNALYPVDVNGDWHVGALDALIVINELNAGGSRPLTGLFASDLRTAGEAEGEGAAQTNYMIDVDGDEYLTPKDALRVINAANGVGDEWVKAEIELTDVAFRRQLEVVPGFFVTLPAERTELTELQPGDTFLASVWAQDIRPTDGSPLEDQFGVYAFYADFYFDADAFSLQPVDGLEPPTGFNFPVSFQNPDHPRTWGQNPAFDEQTYGVNYPNGLRGTVNPLLDIDPTVSGLINDVGGFSHLQQPIGNTPGNDVPTTDYHYFTNLHVFEFAFTVDSIVAYNDSTDVDEESQTGVLVDVLANDVLVNGTKTFSMDGAEDEAGTEILTFGENGDQSASTGSVVPEDKVLFVDKTINVVNNGTLTLDGIAAQGNLGTAVIENNQIRYTPHQSTAGGQTDTFTYQISDGTANFTKIGTVTVTINVVNDPPTVEVPADFSIDEGATHDFGATVQVSDSEADTLLTTISVNSGTLVLPNIAEANVTAGGSGQASVTFSDDPSNTGDALADMVFHPADSDFNGVVVFTITTDDPFNNPVSDSLTITVNAVNDPPQHDKVPVGQTILNNGVLTFDIGTATEISVSDPLDAAYAPAGDVVVETTLTVNNGTLTLAAGATVGLESATGNGTGTLVLTGLTAEINQALDGMTYAPNAGFIGGIDTLTITTDDLGNIGSGTTNPAEDTVEITVTPTQLPFAINDTYAGAVVEEGPAVTIDVLANDFNNDIEQGGANLVIVSVTPVSGTAGIVAANGNTEIEFTPDADYNGQVVFSYTMEDTRTTGTTSSASVTVNVTAKNDAPVVTVDSPQQTDEDVDAPLPNGVITVTDVDAGNGDLLVTVVVSDGTVSLGQTTGLAFTAGDGNDDAYMVFRGTLAELQAAIPDSVFHPNDDFFGDATISITVNDQGNTGGAALEDIAVLTINVSSVNDAPQLTAPSTASVLEDNTLSFTNGNTISVVDVDADPAGIQVGLVATDGDLLITPGTLTGGDLDGSDGTLTLIGTTTAVNAALASLQYDPDADFNGPATLKINVTDNGNTGSGPAGTLSEFTVNIDVDPVNDPPTVANDDLSSTLTINEDSTTTIPFTALTSNDSPGQPANESGQGLTITQVTSLSGNAQYTLSGSNVIFTPAANANGEFKFTYVLQDVPGDGTTPMTPAGGALGTVTLNVEALNDAPELTAPATASVLEDNTLSFTNVSTISVVDVDADPAGIQVGLVVTNGDLLITPGTLTGGDLDGSDGTLTLAGTTTAVNAALASLQYDPDADFNGPATLKINVDDNGNTGSGPAGTLSEFTVNIDVDPVNDPPTVANDDLSSTLTINEDSTTTIPFSTLTSNDSPGLPANESGQGLTITQVTSLSGNAQYSLSGSNVIFTPAANANGQFKFTYVLQDIPGDGTTPMTPSGNALGTVTINVTSVNDPPVITAPTSVSAIQDATITFSATQNRIQVTDVDAAASDITVKLTLGGNLNGTLTLPQTLPPGLQVTPASNPTSITLVGTVAEIDQALNGLQFTPGAGQEGNDELTIDANDGGATGQVSNGTTAQKKVTISISGVNDPPVNTLPGNQNVDEDVDFVFSTANNTEISIRDDDAADKDVRVQLSVELGTLTVVPTAGVTITPVSGSGNSVTLQGPQDSINQALDGMTYRAPNNWNSTDNVNPTLSPDGQITLTVTTNDLGNFGAENPPVENVVTNSLTITVDSVNDDPTANDDYSTEEPLLILRNSSDNVIEPLGNDTITPDVGETLTISGARIVAGGHGTVTFDDTTVTYTPAADTEGVTTIEYDIDDGNGGTSTANIYVNTVDFVPADFSGCVYVDANGNGVKDNGEVGLAGVAIRLTGKTIQGNNLDLTVVTDSDGNYVFENVMPSGEGEHYTIAQMQPGAYKDGAESHEGYVGTAGNDAFTFALDRFGLKKDAQGNVIQSGANNNFGEAGLTAENFQFSITRDLFHSDGGYDPEDQDSGGMFFGFDAAGNLQWYMNLGGWDDIMPGWQADADVPFDVTLSGNGFRATNTAEAKVYQVSIDPASYRMLQKVNADGSTVIQIIGQKTASGITWNQVTQAAPEAEADDVVEMMTGQGDAQQYTEDVDAIFGEAGMLA